MKAVPLRLEHGHGLPILVLVIVVIDILELIGKVIEALVDLDRSIAKSLDLVK